MKKSIVIFFSIIFSFNNCSEKIAVNKEKLLIDKPGVELIKDLRVIYSTQGNVRAILQSPKALNFIEGNDPYQEFPKGFSVQFLEGSDSVICTLKAKYALKKNKTKLTEIRDGVLLKSNDGKTMTTEQLFWDENKHVYYGEKPVQVVTPDEVINGIGFQSREDFTQYKVLQVTGYKLVQSSGDGIDLK